MYTFQRENFQRDIDNGFSGKYLNSDHINVDNTTVTQKLNSTNFGKFSINNSATTLKQF